MKKQHQTEIITIKIELNQEKGNCQHWKDKYLILYN